jgi:hypothetical protein
MLPQTYELPAALVLLLAGTVACFAGYRLFRFVLAIFGFILGAMLASSLMGISNTAGMVLAAVIGGLAGAAILMFAYFVGIALVGAALGALVAHFGWAFIRSGDPPVFALIALAVIGAVGAMFIQRHVIVVTTAFVGAWTMIIGMLAAIADRGAVALKSTSSVWILYPTTLGYRWLPFVWIALGLAGTVVQLGVTGKKR